MLRGGQLDGPQRETSNHLAVCLPKDEVARVLTDEGRYMKNLGLAHHFKGKAQLVGAAECEKANKRALADLIQKMEEKHGEKLYDKENCRLSVRLPSSRSASHVSYLSLTSSCCLL
jgi:hypothetical protein